MSEPRHQMDELLARIEFTAKARHHASERLAVHQKLSMCTLVVLAFALVLIALLQMIDMAIGVDGAYLPATAVVLGVLVLAYALLIGQEKFVLAVQSMRRSAIELERLGRRLGARDPQRLSEADHATAAKEFFDIIEKSDNHQTVDCLASRLLKKPRSAREWPAYLWVWVRAQLFGACNFLHYAVSLGFVVFVFLCLFNPMAAPVEDVIEDAASAAENMAREDSAPANPPAKDGKRR